MTKILFSLIILWSSTAFAVPCDCQVVAYSPISGKFRSSPKVLASYQLEEFDNQSRRNQLVCRKLCLHEFESTMNTEKINSILLKLSQKLVSERALGYNCTGFTTLKYPVRVKASLGNMGIGNVSDQIHIINYEKMCFSPE